MSLLNTVNPEQAEGTVAAIYRQAGQMMGFVPNALRLDSVNPAHMERHWAGIGEAVSHPTLSRKLFTMIRLLVSEIHRCDYCIGMNAAMLMNGEGMSREDIDRLATDPGSAPLNPKERALLLFALDAVRDSNGVTAEQVEALREAGCSDREIFDVTVHASQMVAGDIMLNTFKVQPD